MRLHCWRDQANFGDALNLWLWPSLLGDLVDCGAAEAPAPAGRAPAEDLLVGIGTLLNGWLPRARRLWICGAGVGYGGAPQPEATWRVLCVRGPLSAKAIGVPAGLAATDPAALLHRLWPARGERRGFAFLPHWRTAGPALRESCARAGVTFIDPLGPVEAVLRAIDSCAVLLAGAMHGAIAADALRVPWVPVDQPHPDRLPFKWFDWTLSLGLDYRPAPISSVPEEVEPQLRSLVAHGRPSLSRLARLSLGLEKLDLAIGRLRRECGAAEASPRGPPGRPATGPAPWPRAPAP